MINSKTALKRIYREISEPIADNDNYAMGWGFSSAAYTMWMMKEGFRTDTPKCVAARWLKTWLMCDEIIEIKARTEDGGVYSAYWFSSVDSTVSALVGSTAYRYSLNKIYDGTGAYSRKLRYPPAPPEEASP